MRSLETKLAEQTETPRIEAILMADPRSNAFIHRSPRNEVAREVGAIHREVRVHRSGSLALEERAQLEPRAAAKGCLASLRDVDAGRAIVEALVTTKHQRRERAAERER